MSLTPIISKSERRITQFISIILWVSSTSIFIGVMVIVGWLFHIELFKTVLPGLANMKFNTALCFIMLGASLWLLNTELPKNNTKLTNTHWAGLLSLGVFITALLTVYEYISGLNLGIDQFFYTIHGPDDSFYPGRMAVGTAFSFLVLSFALLLLSSSIQKLHDFVPYLLIAPASVGLLSIIGYLYGDYSLYSPLHTAMALHTAFLFLFLSIGTFCLQPNPLFRAMWLQAGTARLILQGLIPTAIVLILVQDLRTEQLSQVRSAVGATI